MCPSNPLAEVNSKKNLLVLVTSIVEKKRTTNPFSWSDSMMLGGRESSLLVRSESNEEGNAMKNRRWGKTSMGVVSREGSHR
jgi:hypothetical protein